jgi:hypothetical protein
MNTLKPCRMLRSQKKSWKWQDAKCRRRWSVSWPSIKVTHHSKPTPMRKLMFLGRRNHDGSARRHHGRPAGRDEFLCVGGPDSVCIQLSAEYVTAFHAAKRTHSSGTVVRLELRTREVFFRRCWRSPRTTPSRRQRWNSQAKYSIRMVFLLHLNGVARVWHDLQFKCIKTGQCVSRFCIRPVRTPISTS